MKTFAAHTANWITNDYARIRKQGRALPESEINWPAVREVLRRWHDGEWTSQMSRQALDLLVAS